MGMAPMSLDPVLAWGGGTATATVPASGATVLAAVATTASGAESAAKHARPLPLESSARRRLPYSQLLRRGQSPHCGVSPHRMAPCVIMNTCERYSSALSAEPGGVLVGSTSYM